MRLSPTRFRLLPVVILIAASLALAQAPAISFTVSMEQARDHIYHVEMRCRGLSGELQDFKMPVWTPGYYRIMDYARFVSNFRAEDGQGRALPWEKATKNTWRVVTGNAAAVTVNYDVLATSSFVASNFLDEKRGYISPPGLFLHVAGRLAQAVTVTYRLPAGWSRIATGLDPVKGSPNTYSAPDFDLFYDSPVLLGNQEALTFAVQGKPHHVAIENVPESVDRAKMLADLQRIVEASAAIIGDIPYRHYTFLMMGAGNGGIEHTNSASISFNGNSLTNPQGYQRWLSYVAHEYFHHYNVKRIRPLALGPFDYDRENLTNMLWVSEGLSVYYQDLVMVRAGLMTREEYLDKIRGAIARLENAPGHRYQSATDASMSAWGGSGIGGDRNTTVSYYEKGPSLGIVLDLAIRHHSGNRKSLDDVMRALYRKYYQERKRGFTDTEFRRECEAAAGGDLSEVFEYAATSKDIDYPKYFAYAGLDIDVTPRDASGVFLGLNTQTREGKLVVSGVAADSPAQRAGLAAGDVVLEVDGQKATAAKALQDILAARQPTDRIRLRITRQGEAREMEAVLEKNVARSYSIRPIPDPTPQQTAILKDWLRAVGT